MLIKNEAIPICRHYLSALEHRLRGLFHRRLLSPPLYTPYRKTASSFFGNKGTGASQESC